MPRPSSPKTPLSKSIISNSPPTSTPSSESDGGHGSPWFFENRLPDRATQTWTVMHQPSTSTVPKVMHQPSPSTIPKEVNTIPQLISYLSSSEEIDDEQPPTQRLRLRLNLSADLVEGGSH
jgi:hypothetical protein